MPENHLQTGVTLLPNFSTNYSPHRTQILWFALLLFVGLCVGFWKLAMVIILIIALTKTINNRIKAQLDHIREELKSYQQKCVVYKCRCLGVVEYLKYVKMIEMGYQFYSNTNIISQIEQSRSWDVNLLDKQLPFYQKFKHAIKMLDEMVTNCLGQNLFQSDQSLKYFLNLNHPKFKDILSLHKILKKTFQNLQIISQKFDLVVINPFFNNIKLAKLLIKTKMRIFPLLRSFQNQIDSIQQLIIQKMNQFSENTQFKEIYIYLSDHTYYQLSPEAQKILKKLEHIYDDLNKRNQKTVKILKAQEIVQIQTQKETTIKKDFVGPQLITSKIQQKLYFMKNLDALLTMGIAKRKIQKLQRQERQADLSVEVKYKKNKIDGDTVFE